MKQKALRRTILSGLIAISVSAALIVGATFAWFSDSVTNKKNRIQAGNLKIDAYAYKAAADGSIQLSREQDLRASAAPIIDEDKFMPGGQGVRYLKVVNSGNVPVKVKLKFSVANGGLIDALWFDFVKTDAAWTEIGQFTRRPMSELAAFADGYVFTLNPPEGSAESSLNFKLYYGMYESAESEYAGKGFTADVTILATQTDAAAEGKVVLVGGEADFANPAANATYILTGDVALTQPLIFTDYANLDMNGYTLTGDISYIIPSGVGVVRIGKPNVGGTIDGTVTVDAPGATVVHYGEVNVVDVKAVANHSYHFYGILKRELKVAKGRVVVEFGATVQKLTVTPNAGQEAKVVVSGEVTEQVPAGTPGVEVVDELSLSTPQDLIDFSERVANGATFAGKTVTLKNNVDLSGVAWTPIGTGYSLVNAKPFSGAFEGGGFRIDNLNAVGVEDQRCGLFGVTVDAVIRNVTVSGQIDACADSGGIVGWAIGTTVDGCTSEVNLNSGIRNLAAQLGGIIGEAESCTVTNCTNSGDVYSANGANGVGGIVGYAEKGLTVSDCRNTGAVTAKQTAGGIIGQISTYGAAAGNAFAVSGCVNGGAVTGLYRTSGKTSSNTGGIVGKFEEVGSSTAPLTVSGCVNTAIITGVSYPDTPRYGLEQIVGTSAYNRSLTLTENRSEGSVADFAADLAQA